MNVSDIEGLNDKVYDCSIDELGELIDDLRAILDCRETEEG